MPKYHDIEEYSEYRTQQLMMGAPLSDFDNDYYEPDDSYLMPDEPEDWPVASYKHPDTTEEYEALAQGGDGEYETDKEAIQARIDWMLREPKYFELHDLIAESFALFLADHPELGITTTIYSGERFFGTKHSKNWVPMIFTVDYDPDAMEAIEDPVAGRGIEEALNLIKEENNEC